MQPVAMGIETEYGLLWDGAEDGERHIAADSLFQRIQRSVWRDPLVMGELMPFVQKTRDENVTNELQFLGNGSRFYLDGDHPELSTAESVDPREAVLYDEAGAAILAEAVARLHDNQPMPRILKRSGDGWGHTWGCHENFAISPWLHKELIDGELKSGYPFLLGTFLVVRQLLTGAGKFGPDVHSEKWAFQHSQRADFIRLLHGFNTLQDRAIINTRDEPLADADLTKRLHLICGEANRCQWSTYLKMALTAAFLRMLQDRSRPLAPLPVIIRKEPNKDYPAAFRMVSRDLEMDARYPVCILGPGAEVSTSSSMTAVDILSRYVNAIAEYSAATNWGNERLRTSYVEASGKAVWAMQQLATKRWRALYGILDWPTKRIIAEEYFNRKGHTWRSAVADAEFWGRVRTLTEVNYTVLNTRDSIYHRLVDAGRIREVFKRSDVARAMGTAPSGRARQRMQLAMRYRKYLHVVDWFAVQFKQPDLTTTVGFPQVVGVAQPAFDHALSVCPTPMDFAAFVERYPIQGLVSNVSFA